jgi:hypothetical protein
MSEKNQTSCLRFYSTGGDRLKFSDVIIATVSSVLMGLILDAILLVALIPLGSNSRSDLLAHIISFLVASLVVGYVFALKIQEESRIRAIGVIVVLSTFTVMIFYSIWFANAFAFYWLRESLINMFNTSGWTNYHWNAYTALFVSIVAIITMVIIFIGLYAGSMLRKSPAKTKE